VFVDQRTEKSLIAWDESKKSNRIYMNHYCEQWIADWCLENGWTDWFAGDERRYWAFPPHAVMPTPLPATVLQAIKAKEGMSPDERVWVGGGLVSLVVGGLLTYVLGSPLPALAAFGFCAGMVAHLEEEDLN
jgi:hypothetical protein